MNQKRADDAAACEASKSGEHEWRLIEVVTEPTAPGMALTSVCRWCGRPAVEGSAHGESGRPPLPPTR